MQLRRLLKIKEVNNNLPRTDHPEKKRKLNYVENNMIKELVKIEITKNFEKLHHEKILTTIMMNLVMQTKTN